MFVGEHNRSVDEKGRLSLPASFRDALGDLAYVAKTGKCLSIYSQAGLGITVAELEERVSNDEATQNTLRRFGASVQSIKVDSQGRIVLPAKHRQSADLESDVVVIGALKRIEIYRPDRWDAIQQSDDGALTDGSWM